VTERRSPQRWANELTLMLNQVFASPSDRFPVKVEMIAREISAARFPDDPITLIKGDNLPGFEGGLFKAPPGKKGWGIIYNKAVTSPRRINFTLAHEFGHYLVHRLDYPDGIQCSQDDLIKWDSEYRKIEQEANLFAATLLMPLDDFRRQIPADAKPDLDDLSACADRYHVSFIAAVRRWLEYTNRRSVLVVSRAGYILWAYSSQRALRTGAYFRTANVPPVAIPEGSLAAQPHLMERSRGCMQHDPNVWFREPCEEMVIASDQYDFTISILHLDNIVSHVGFSEEAEEDVYERMMRRSSRD